MPEISRFYGIVIGMYYGDHPPPHFHARYGEHQARIDVETGAILTGRLPPKAAGLVMEWTTLHRKELRENWNRAEAHETLEPVPPLE